MVTIDRDAVKKRRQDTAQRAAEKERQSLIASTATVEDALEKFQESKQADVVNEGHALLTVVLTGLNGCSSVQEVKQLRQQVETPVNEKVVAAAAMLERFPPSQQSSLLAALNGVHQGTHLLHADGTITPKETVQPAIPPSPPQPAPAPEPPQAPPSQPPSQGGQQSDPSATAPQPAQPQPAQPAQPSGATAQGQQPSDPAQSPKTDSQSDKGQQGGKNNKGRAGRAIDALRGKA